VELEQLHFRRTLKPARLDHTVVDGGGIGCSKRNGDDWEDSREVHFVYIFEVSELDLLMRPCCSVFVCAVDDAPRETIEALLDDVPIFIAHPRPASSCVFFFIRPSVSSQLGVILLPIMSY
jgi:hypothetical protein